MLPQCRGSFEGYIMASLVPPQNGYQTADKSKLSIKERVQFMSFYVLCQLANFVGMWWLFLAILGGSRNRAWRLTLSYDQVANAAFGGSEDETISSRAGKARDANKKWGCILCKVLDFIEKNHCDLAKELFIKDLTPLPLAVMFPNAVPRDASALTDPATADELEGYVFTVPDAANVKHYYVVTLKGIIEIDYLYATK